MIKRVTFATPTTGAPPSAFMAAWREAVGAGADAPGGVRPLRIAVCCVVPGIGADPPHGGVGLEWFADGEHLARFETWRGGGDGPPAIVPRPGAAGTAPGDGTAVDWAASPCLVADEVVVRGAEWLERRWQEGGPKLKQMAIARRAHGLTPGEFSERWRSRAGFVGRPGQDGTLVIPPEVRGHAYVQNHPLPLDAGDVPYDAVNEVYFDDLRGLQARVDWFAAHLEKGAEDDLISENWFLALTEEVVLPAG